MVLSYPMPTTPLTGTGVHSSRTVAVVLIMVCQSFQALVPGAVALLLPAIRKDLDLTFTQGGTLAAVHILAYCLMQIPSGYLADRFSTKRIFITGLIGCAVLALTFGLITEYWQVLVNQVLLGLFRALIFIPGMTMITGWFPPERRTTALGLYMMGGFSSVFLFSIIAPSVVAWFDWRFVFFSLSALGTIGVAIFLRFGKEQASRSDQKVNFLEVLRLFRYRVMWVCGAIQFIRLGTMQAFSFWLPSFLIDEKGLPLQLAGFIVAGQALIIAPSGFVGGYVSDRLKNPILVISGSLAILGITAVLMVNIGNIAWLVVVIGIGAMFLQMYFAPMFAIPVEILGRRIAGTSSGVSNFFATMGAISSSYTLGALKDATAAFSSGYYATAVACFVGLAFALLLARMRRQRIGANTLPETT